MKRIEKWGILTMYGIGQPTRHLQGHIYGHPDFRDGTFVTTSAIVKQDEQSATTKDGSSYLLGEKA